MWSSSAGRRASPARGARTVDRRSRLRWTRWCDGELAGEEKAAVSAWRSTTTRSHAGNSRTGSGSASSSSGYSSTAALARRRPTRQRWRTFGSSRSGPRRWGGALPCPLRDRPRPGSGLGIPSPCLKLHRHGRALGRLEPARPNLSGIRTPGTRSATAASRRSAGVEAVQADCAGEPL